MRALATAVIFFAILLREGLAIRCYQCRSSEHMECLEKFIRPSTLVAESCAHVMEAQYCVKTTGIYEGEVGTTRFCSSRDHGDYCEYVQRPGDDRHYRSCVYTCTSDSCNHAVPTSRPVAPLVVLAAALCLWRYRP